MPTDNDNRKSQYFVATVISFLALTAAATHIFKDGQEIDQVDVELLLIAIFPWAGSFVKTFEIFGMKGELKDLKKEIALISGAAQDASQMSALAAAGASDAPAQHLSSASGPGDLDKLALEYIATRNRMRPGSERTTEMTSIFSKMASLAFRVDNFDVRKRLKDTDPGYRLAAYAYLYSRPDASLLDALVESVTRIENKPFGQYWGIKTIGKVLDLADPIPKEIISNLQEFLLKLKRGTDRYFALSTILNELPTGKTM
jgi:hypothetical protein